LSLGRLARGDPPRDRRRPALMRGALASLAALALGACTVGPNYTPPQTPTPPAYQETAAKPAAPLSATTAAAPDLAAWWTQFHDPTLDSLVTRALAGNLDVATSVSRIRQAREQIIIARAAALPQVNADVNVNNTLLSKNAGLTSLAGIFR